MPPQTISFFIACAILIGIKILITVAKRKKIPFFESFETTKWNLSHLALASFLTLFAELAFIRWIAVEVRVFAYCKNLALLLCFVGFGIGCALANKPVRWQSAVTSLLGLILVI